VRKNWPRRISPATTRTLPPARLGGRGHSRSSRQISGGDVAVDQARERRCAYRLPAAEPGSFTSERVGHVWSRPTTWRLSLEDQETGVELEYRVLRSTRPATVPRPTWCVWCSRTFAFFEGFDLPEPSEATAWRMSA